MRSGGGLHGSPPPAPVICSPCRSAPTDNGRENRVAFIFRLELEDGTPADPPRLDTAVPNWRAGDTIPLGGGRILRVIDIRPGEQPDDASVPVVEAA
jgi:hypothetical protein